MGGENARRSAGAVVLALALSCGGRSGLLADSTVATGGGAAGGESDAGSGAAGAGGGADDGGDSATDAGTGDASTDEADDACVGDCGPIDLPPPRLVAPLSTATATSQTPTLHWELPPGADGAGIDVCRDRACSSPVATFDAAGTSGAPPLPLAAGVYFWRARARAGGRASRSASAPWELWVGARSAPVDTSWGTTPDFDGDGYPELVVGADRSANDVGVVFVYPGGPSGPSATPITLVGPSTQPITFGWSVASAGDVNGDGFADLVVGATGGNGFGLPGNAYVYMGGANGLSLDPVSLVGPAPTQGNAFFGCSVASAGDLNGDGYGDLVVGANGIATAYVYYGGPRGITTTPAATLGNHYTTTGSMFGIAVASAGDVDGDGYPDLLVGARGFLDGNGWAFLYAGGPDWTSRTPLMLVGAEAGFGYALASAGDVNGDGLADVVIGDIGETNHFVGAAFVYLGSARDLLAPTPITLPAPPSVTLMAESVASAGDVNGDGLGDVIVAAAADSEAGTRYLYLGTADGVAPLPTQTLGAAGTLWATVAGAGDVNHDGFADVLTGEPWSNGAAGRALLYLGGASGLATSPALLLYDPFDAGPGGALGCSVK